MLTPQGLTAEQQLILPTRLDEVTYWDGSAPLDGPEGAILIAGHVDDASRGAGVFHQLHSVQPGDAVYIAKSGTIARWKIVSLEHFDKQDLPEYVFRGAAGPRQLYLVTCGGEVVQDAQGRSTYLENVVATAVPF